ncbi:hypothetical protein Dtox_0738 [Desulfofarcimen acetoxidans DSM 771]|uniref:Uncharacterized protein n=1 Tax=Desulfofarcimen acetoxidans (strain ATCC 49208 / DSM 771 / KCTC 5769 / VKM B-1644 / 5575) TaxID=485916 RepID=C8W1K6_DESAS|nr:hypothetical protein [Desulfofarcimen acetoxidans]ACV61651.1 hypothetical protein Dtox_0738 [Desulfofarcimen acetoxidans DSM 771]
MFTVLSFAASANEDVAKQSTEKSQYEKLSKDIENYLKLEDGKLKIDTNKMEIDGYSETIIQSVEKQYQEFNISINSDQVSSKSIGSAAVKKAAQWLKSNWSKVYAKIPTSVKAYFSFDVVSKYIDAYVKYSDTINEYLANIVNACLPSSLEWMTPGIVATIELLLPF